MAKVKVRLVYDDILAAWRVSMPWNEKAKDDLKSRIPHTARQWDNSTKQWVVDPLFLDVVKEICETYFDGWVEYRAQTAPPAPSPSNDAYRTILLIAPKEELKRFYRAVCIALHPDKHGGDGKQMATFNAAWQSVQKELGV